MLYWKSVDVNRWDAQMEENGLNLYASTHILRLAFFFFFSFFFFIVLQDKTDLRCHHDIAGGHGPEFHEHAE